MNKKAIYIGLALAFTLTLCGCQLAREDAAAAQSDRMIGAFITTKSLDLFDAEAYINDNLRVTSGGDVIIDDANSAQYQGRVYATLETSTSTNEETGEKSETWEYVFDTLEGLPFFVATYTTPSGGIYFGSTITDGISDAHFVVNQGTDENSLSLTGTVYMAPGAGQTIFVNPMYQSTDGRVFLTSGNGFSSEGNTVEGVRFETTLEATQTFTTPEGKTTRESFIMSIAMGIKTPPERVNLFYMSEQNAVLSTQNYTPATLPESLTIPRNVAYIITETYASKPDGNTAIQRELLQPGDDMLTSYTLREDAILVEKQAVLTWTGRE